MSSPSIVGAAQTGEVETALADDRVVVVAGEGGYQLAAAAARPVGLHTLDSLLPARAEGAIPLYLVGHRDQAAELASEWTDETRQLTERVWPGPVTVMVPAGLDVAHVAVTPDMSVQIGMSTNRTLRKLCRDVGPLLVATMHGSDNRPLLTAADAVAACASDDVALILEGGTCEGPGPTVVDCTVTPFVVRHEGALPESYLDATMMMGLGKKKWFSRRRAEAEPEPDGNED
ncbi:MAG TPA: Sua5/YciO/YrdC/YwlC family protein [Acidimicrobiales bacterium]